MKHLVQRPLPDESLCSALIRTCRRTGLSIGALTPALLGGRKWYPGFFQGGHLSVLSDAMGLAEEDLLWSHTYFPYSTAFFDKVLFDRCHANALSTGKVAIGQSSVTQSVSEHCPFRRFCASCARADTRRWGESYWHRSHNLPGVLFCLKHDRLLVETQLPTTGIAQWRDVLPSEATGRAIQRSTHTRFDIELAHASVAKLVRDPSPASSVPDRTYYRHALIRKGLLSSHRQVNAQQLTNWATATIGANASRLGLRPSDLDFTWMTQMVRPNVGVPWIPLKHLIFQTTLSIGTKAPQTVLDHIPTGPSGPSSSHVDQFDAECARRLKTVVHAAIRAGEQIRIQDALSAVGCWSAYRHARNKFPETAAVVLALRRSDASQRRIPQ